MWRNLGCYIASILMLMCLLAISYYCYGIYAAIQFFAQPHTSDSTVYPAVSILKPICGIDSQAYDNLASFCKQEYPEYQIIFGVQDRSDPSLEVVKQIIHDFPDIDIQFVISDRPLGTNRKTGNLVNAFAKAKYEILLLSDADVRVKPNYLQEVVQPLSDEEVGVVTCLYRSLAQGWVAALEALSTTTDFHPGVLVSNQLEGIKFAMGQTIVIRRSVLKQIGGFERIANYLADDFQLGHRPAQAGYKVVLSHHIIEHVLGVSTIGQSGQRQLRWMLGIRVSRPWGYTGLIVTYGTVTSLLFLLVMEGAPIGWFVLAVTWVLRLSMAWLIGVKNLRDPVASRLFWLVPLRDLISFSMWCYGFFDSPIRWRDQQFRLTREGELVVCTEGSDAQCAVHY